jgi:hypothetical protein
VIKGKSANKLVSWCADKRIQNSETEEKTFATRLPASGVAAMEAKRIANSCLLAFYRILHAQKVLLSRIEGVDPV